jgi:hypothetical protein
MQKFSKFKKGLKPTKPIPQNDLGFSQDFLLNSDLKSLEARTNGTGQPGLSFY